MSDTTEWLRPDKAPKLAENVIDVWRASLDMDSAALENLRSTLAGDEVARAERFILERDRNHFIAARGILRDLLARYLRCAPKAVGFVYGPRGKPAISEMGSPRRLRFNLSHSNGLALVAISCGCEVGIDVELIRPDFGGEEIARRYFSSNEVGELKRLPHDLRAEGFFLCWTRKEAYIKAKGDGLHISLDSFDVSLTPGLPALLNSVDRSRWSVHSLTPAPGFAGAVVGEGDSWELRLFNWQP